MTLRLYNSLTRKKEEFTPLDPGNVRMYVCGPTVYDHAHIGNARPVIVFDVLYRLLRHLYGETHVKYVRNITDVDDKIMERAVEQGVSIDVLTKATADQFHADVAALGCLAPDVEPRATDHIEEMKTLIQTLIDKGCAYVADGHVLFDVPAWKAYGELSGRSTDEMIAGARVEVAPYKKSPMDFVLWKPSTPDQPGWDSDWGRGRPGWHIECSAMAEKHLGKVFDIHGGGVDLKFPHHENEIAQSRCAHGTHAMANIWMHNGFLQVEGEKMSKSAGNFLTIRELLLLEEPLPALIGTQSDKAPEEIRTLWNGLSARLAMLLTLYRQPLDWTRNRFFGASNELYSWYELLRKVHYDTSLDRPADANSAVLEGLCDDLNTSAAITAIRQEYKKQNAQGVAEGMRIIGLLDSWFVENDDVLLFDRHAAGADKDEIVTQVDARIAARKAKDFAEADRIRDELVTMGVVLKDRPDGTTEWEISR